MDSPTDTIKQLNSARDIVLRDANIYPQVIPGVLPVIGAGAPVEQRRWGADFLAEAFASPVVSAEDKQKMVVTTDVLHTVKGYLTRKKDVGQEEDPAVIKSAIQCAASIYPFVFRHTLNASDEDMWGKMAVIKSSILRRMDSGPAGVRICCVKFVAVVVQVQTPGLIADPRRQEQNEISLALVPREHSVLKVGNLEAEASGLLDRLMYVLQENSVYALLVSATINSLSTLVQRRASISNKILGTLLNFNPLKLATQPMSGKDKVAIRSMTRTTMSFLLNVLKRNPQHSLAARIQQHVERLKSLLVQAFSENRQLKRPAPDEHANSLDAAKRQRVDGQLANGNATATAPPMQNSTFLPPGSTMAQLFTLTNDKAVTGFHVEQIPLQYVAQLVPPLLASIDQARFTLATNIVKERLLNLSRQPPADARAAARAVVGDDDDDYDPAAAFQDGDAEQVLNQLDQMPPQGLAGPGIAIGPFTLPTPPPMNDEEREEYTKTALMRIFDTLRDMDQDAKTKFAKKEVPKGFNRIHSVTTDRDGWLTLITRIATRTQPHDSASATKQENWDRSLVKGKDFNNSLSTRIRETLLTYIMEDFRRRINVAIAWLNEEWYCERMHHKQDLAAGRIDTNPTADKTPLYTSYVLRLLDSMIPYLDTKDNKVLIRFISEIPSLPVALFPRLEKVADDPERVALVVQGLMYLVMLRPPVKEMALDALERLWRNNEDARKSAEKVLVKWRPEVVKNGLEEGREVKGEVLF